MSDLVQRLMQLADAYAQANGVWFDNRHLSLEKELTAERDASRSALEAALREALQNHEFAGWFHEIRCCMNYRLWEQGGADPEPGDVALYT